MIHSRSSIPQPGQSGFPPPPESVAAGRARLWRRRARRRRLTVGAVALGVLVVGGNVAVTALGPALSSGLTTSSGSGDVDVRHVAKVARSQHDPSKYDSGGMDPTFKKAVNKAVAGAKRDKVKITIMSGYRTYDKQLQLYEDKVAEVGSEEAARTLVLPPWESMHVRGKAIDVDQVGAAWLKRKGHRYGLCQRYRNEWWHYELLTKPGRRCPAMEETAAEGNGPG